MQTFSGRRTRVLAATTATAGLVLVAVTASGCTSSGNGGSGTKTAAGGVELVKAGQLTTCTHLPYPPFQSEIDGKVQGFDVSLIDLVAKNLGVKQQILDTPFENFKTGAFLNSGECDLAAAGMTITAERKKNVDFSDPYFDATQALLVDKEQRHHLARRREGQEGQARRPGADHRRGLREEAGLRPGLLRVLRRGPQRPAHRPGQGRHHRLPGRPGLAEEQGERRRLQARQATSTPVSSTASR